MSMFEYLSVVTDFDDFGETTTALMVREILHVEISGLGSCVRNTRNSAKQQRTAMSSHHTLVEILRRLEQLFTFFWVNNS